MTSPTSSSTPPSSPTQRRLPKVTADRAGRWAVVVLWASLVLTAGPALAGAFAGARRPVQLVTSVELWGAWAGALGAAVVPRTVTLTAVRVVMPAAVPVIAWALVTGPPGGDLVPAAAGLGTALAASILVLAAFVGDGFVNGSSYGHERRLLLRPPLPLVIGPIPLTWAVCVAGAATGPVLVTAGPVPVGIGVTVAGGAAAALAARALHGLARRWLVFVPAGVVVHDQLTLVEPVLCTRRAIRRVGPAPAGAEPPARDLTAGAAGLVLQVDLSEPVNVTLRARRATAGSFDVDSFLVAPSRPGAVLLAARDRRIAIG